MNDRGDAIGRLMRWYASHCDGEWEHAYGITIETLDNPGWRIKIDLKDTGLDPNSFQPVVEGEDDGNHRDDGSQIGPWLTTHTDEGLWTAACSPDNLARVLELFLDWAETSV